MPVVDLYPWRLLGYLALLGLHWGVILGTDGVILWWSYTGYTGGVILYYWVILATGATGILATGATGILALLG